MPLTISEFTDSLGFRNLVFTTPEGLSYTRRRDDAFSDTWEGVFTGTIDKEVLVQPPAGRSLALAMAMTLSWDGDPVDAEWFVRAPNGAHRSLGTTNIPAGETAKALYLLSISVNPMGTAIYTPEMVHNGGAVCVTVSDGCGLYLTGWVI